MRLFVLFFCFIIISGCAGKEFIIRSESSPFGVNFFVFVNVDGREFSGRGKGILGRDFFKCNIYDVLFDKFISFLSFDLNKKEIRVYFSLREEGLLFYNESVCKVFTERLYGLFFDSVSDEKEEVVVDEGGNARVEIRVMKRKNSVPRRIGFFISGEGKKGKIIFDITEFDENISIDERGFLFTNMGNYSIFELLESLQ